MVLKGARALVTGGAGSLGSALCTALAESGCDVLIAYLNSQGTAQALADLLSSRYGVKAIPLKVDLTSEQAPAVLRKGAEELLGGLDILVNNAAVNKKLPFEDLASVTGEEWDYIVNTNLRQPFLIARELAPLLRAGRGGRIVNIGSTGGLVPRGSSIPYSVSKAGLVHLTRCLAVALAPDVLVNMVAPAGFPSRMRSASLSADQAAAAVQRTLLKREVSLEDVARQVVTFCQTDSATGQTTVVDGGAVCH